MKYKAVMGQLIDLVVFVLQTNEDEGKTSLQSLIELTQTYADIWQNEMQKLIFVCSDVMKTDTFDLSTRQSALEIISTLVEANPKLVRDQQASLKDNFFPALFLMMTQVEFADDL